MRKSSTNAYLISFSGVDLSRMCRITPLSLCDICMGILPLIIISQRDNKFLTTVVVRLCRSPFSSKFDFKNFFTDGKTLPS